MSAHQNNPIVGTGEQVVVAQERPLWCVALELMIDFVVGTACFACLVYVTCVSNLHIDLLHMTEADQPIIWTLTILKYLTFAGEVLLYAKYLWRTFLRAWHRL